MKILITGSEGMLGSDLIKVLSIEHEIIPLTYEKADITDKISLNNFLKNFDFLDFIIHTAAFTDVDGAETNSEQAFLVNHIGTKNIVEIARKFDVPMVYLSTDYVFDGKKNKPYLEDDLPAPLNQYGLSKLAGEKEVLENLKKFFIVRTAWLYGKNGKNFVFKMLNLAKNNRILKVVDDQKGTPTYSLDLAKAIKDLIKTSAFGIYHLTNSGETTWYQFAKKIFEITEVKVELKPIKSSEFQSPAKRPSYSVLSHRNWLKIGMPELRFWENALEDFIKNDLGYK